MNLPKTLVRLEKTSNTLLLLFEDDSVLKFVAYVEDDCDDDCRLSQEKPSNHNLLQLGIIDDAEYLKRLKNINLDDVRDKANKYWTLS